MSLRIGFDLDEVVVNTTGMLEKYLKETYDIDWPIDCFVRYNFVECQFHEDEETNKEIQADLIRVVNDAEYQFQAAPADRAVRSLQLLKKAGHKLHFISNRPKQNQPLTFKWLRQNKIPFDSVDVIGSEEKGFYGFRYKLDMFVDDLEKHLENMLKYKKKWRKGLLLMDRPWNQDSIDKNKFKRVKTWEEIIRHIGVQNR